jgi:hypothetical protein
VPELKRLDVERTQPAGGVETADPAPHALALPGADEDADARTAVSVAERGTVVEPLVGRELEPVLVDEEAKCGRERALDRLGADRAPTRDALDPPLRGRV